MTTAEPMTSALGSDPPDEPTLSPRALQVIRLIARGMTSRQVASRLHLSVRTVDNYVWISMQRTGTPNRIALIMWATRRELVR